VRVADRVPAAPFRARYEELVANGDTAGAIARRAGWTHHLGGGDTTYLKRLLGLKPWFNPEYGAYWGGEHTRYETAAKLAKAMDLDPVDVGL
jgi:hypothetical protein